MRNRKIFSLVISALFSGAILLHGLPEGTAPVTGGGQVNISGNVMSITAPDGSIFNHSRFDVQNNETVRFIQPSESSRVLNRITTTSLSTINGALEANGKVYFAAPGGLIFGDGAMVNARHLQVIGGNVETDNWGKSAMLTGSIENHGSIHADSIILGGKTVKNKGELSATHGSILIASGEAMELISQGGSTEVELSKVISPGYSVGDLAGHALLESGILEASQVDVVSDNIVQEGAIDAENVSFRGFSQLSGNKGKISAEEVRLEAIPNRFSNVSLDAEDNEVSKVKLDGSFNQLKINSKNSLLIEKTNTLSVSESIIAKEVDIRVIDADISLGVSFAPVYRNTKSSLVLASSYGEIEIEANNFLFDYDQVLIYSNNIFSDLAYSLDTLPENWYVLNATSLEFDSLSAGLDAKTIFQLEAENSYFNLTGSELVSDPLVNAQGVGSQAPPSNSQSTSSGSGGTSGSGPTLIAPQVTPSLSSFANLTGGNTNLTESQLDSAMQLGLYSNNSYLLQSTSQFDLDVAKLFENGGQYILFGKSFHDLQGNEENLRETFILDSSTMQTGDELAFENKFRVRDSKFKHEDSETIIADENKENKTEVSTTSDSKIIQVGMAPVTSITKPVYSTQAGQMLEKALDSGIEETLKGFSNR